MKLIRKVWLPVLSALLLALSMAGCGVEPSSSNAGSTPASDAVAGEGTQPSPDLPGGSQPEQASSSQPNQTGNVGAPDKSKKTTTAKTTAKTPSGNKVEEKIPGYSDIINKKDYDFDGKAVKVGIWYGFQEAVGTDETNLRQKKINQKIEETFNCKLEFVQTSGGSLPALRASIMSGKPMVDFFATQGNQNFYELYASGALLPLDSIASLNIKDTSRFVLTDETKFGGKYYGAVPKTYGWLTRNFNNVLIANFDLLAQAGYSPEKIYGWQNNGEWTWDKFEEVCTAVSKIDGKYGLTDLDQNQMYGFDISYMMYTSMLLSNNTDWVVKDGNGFAFNGGSEPAMKVLNKYAEWANPNKGFIKYTTSAYDDFNSGKSAFLTNIYYGPVVVEWMTAANKCGVVQFPKGPDATDYVSKAYESLFFVIPKGVANIDAIGAVANAFCTPLYSDEESRNLCKNDIMKTAKLQQSVDTLLSIFDDPKASEYPTSLYGVSAGLAMGDGDKLGWYDYVRKVAEGEMTAKQAVDTFSGRANSVLISTYS